MEIGRGNGRRCDDHDGRSGSSRWRLLSNRRRSKLGDDDLDEVFHRACEGVHVVIELNGKLISDSHCDAGR